jgi:capsular exopolysaccharide synthesis family protein
MPKQNALDRAYPGLVAAAPRLVEKEISISDLLVILRRRRHWILVATLISLGFGILYCCVRAPRYDAVSDLAIHPEGSDALDMGDLSSMAGGGGLDWDAKLETQVRILKSQTLAWTTISQLRLDQKPGFAGRRKFFVFGKRITPSAPANIEDTAPERRNHLLDSFAHDLTVESVPRTQAVEIKFRSADPALAANVVNQLASAYLEHNFMTRYEATEQASDWLAKQLNDLREDVETSQNKLADFQKKTGIIGADDDDNLILDKLDAIDKQLTDAKADRIVKEAKYHLASTGDPELIGTVIPDSVLPDLRSQEADLKNQLTQAQSIYGPNYPKVIQLKTQLGQVDDELAKELQDIKERFHTDYEASSSVEGQLQTAFDQQEQAAYKLSGDMSQYGILKRNVESERDLYEDLLKKLKEAGVMAGLRSTNVDIIDKASLPTKAVDPNIPLVISLSLFFGLGCGLGLAFWAESVDSSVRSADELEAIVGLPIFGTVPHFSLLANGRNGHARQITAGPPDNSKGSPITVLRPNSEASESFRSIRTSVLLSAAGTPPKTVLVASGLPGDGKSTISTNIAVVLAQRGARVLLVDADLRRGMLAQTLGLTQNSGLSGALTSSGSWREAVEPVAGVDSLFVLQGGLRPPNPADLLGSATMDTLLAEWSKEFDQVIIDSPPCLVVTDGVMLAPKMDAVLLVARVGHTPRLGVRRTVELLQSVDATVAGVVLNDFSIAGTYYGYGYGYRYSHYSKYYDDPKEAAAKA